MSTAVKDKNAVLTISKRKIKELISIEDIAHRYSPKINVRTRRPLIICPFHEDHNLGSCRIFLDTNTFKCESCGTQGDMLKLASGYLNIDILDMNSLLERLVLEFGIIRDSVLSDYTGDMKKRPPPERLSPEEYAYLLMDDHYTVPTKFEQVEYEKDEWDYVPCEYTRIYYRTLAVKDPEFHDWVICTVSRKYWFRYAHMAFFCQKQGYILLEDVINEHMEKSIRLLRKSLINKKLYREELRLRNDLLSDLLNTGNLQHKNSECII